MLCSMQLFFFGARKSQICTRGVALYQRCVAAWYGRVVSCYTLFSSFWPRALYKRRPKGGLVLYGRSCRGFQVGHFHRKSGEGDGRAAWHEGKENCAANAFPWLIFGPKPTGTEGLHIFSDNPILQAVFLIRVLVVARHARCTFYPLQQQRRRRDRALRPRQSD